MKIVETTIQMKITTTKAKAETETYLKLRKLEGRYSFFHSILFYSLFPKVCKMRQTYY